MLRIGLIGDPHFSVKNIKEMTIFCDKIYRWIRETNPDILVVLGDILHTHAIIHVKPLMMAIDFLRGCAKLCPTYLLIGNHDRPNNSNFLTTEHPFNGINIDNLTIVDTGLVEILEVDGGEFHLAFIPYVPAGRFIEAYDQIVKGEKIDLVFAHQEFKGCNLGASVSETGDHWSKSKPPVISGHIHIKQTLSNIHYVGTPLQHEFGDETQKGVHLVHLSKGGITPLHYYPLNICTKIVKTIKAKKFHLFEPQEETQTKLIVSGTPEELAIIRNSDKVLELRKKNCTVLFKAIGGEKIIIKKFKRRYLDNLFDILEKEEKEYLRSLLEL